MPRRRITKWKGIIANWQEESPGSWTLAMLREWIARRRGESLWWNPGKHPAWWTDGTKILAAARRRGLVERHPEHSTYWRWTDSGRLLKTERSCHFRRFGHLPASVQLALTGNSTTKRGA